MKKVCIDLFCGTGGFSHGWIEAGGIVAVAVDVWREALDNHQHNHPDVPVLQLELGGSIEKTASILRSYLKALGFDDFHFHLHGSPPCQALSNMSHNLNADDGMGLVNWFLELKDYMKPDSWSMENVVPLGKRLRSMGVPYEILDSSNFGVAQKRRRVFAGEGWKVKETTPKENLGVIDALPYLVDELLPASRIVSRRRKAIEEPQTYDPQGPAHTITQLPHMIERFHVDSDRAKKSKKCGINPRTGKKEGGSGFLSRSIQEPIYTIRSTPRRIIELTKDNVQTVRSFTIDESAILQGWPGMLWLNHFKKKEMWVMVGNMVCPPVAYAICEGVEL